ncbi:hybrid sensor histidine kinase/response regulator [Actomonas aquatica]|uniref:histidine kinase n=1 Tax=Actomonas aquatica TaxID=2866162 RepID=A0ABZ1C4B7_9BACT|nr:ATP-binding protein [Opitutus sp. WL0086]WRQ86563.1 ATP-binding protein [Opitutus sp. WL0086]
MSEDLQALKLRALDAAENAIMITDCDGIILWVNPAWERLTGYPAAEAVGQTPRILKSGVQDAAFYEGFWRTVLAGKSVKGEVVNRRKDGSHYTELETITPVLDKAGRVSHFIAVKQDITESRRVEENLRQTQKLEALGHLAGGVAHDFNNLLTVIRGQAQLAALERGVGEALRGSLEEIERAADQAASLTRQLLVFSRRQAWQPAVFDVAQTLRRASRLWTRLAGDHIRCELDIEHDPVAWQVRGDESMIEQVVMNLVVNARDAMPAGGSINIRALRREATGEEVRDGVAVVGSAGMVVELVVADAGTGMPPEVCERVFEPFFSTKGPGKGTGLGLATVYAVVRRHGGAVRIASEVGRGTVVTVVLPLTEEAIPESVGRVAEGTTDLGAVSVWVVEDDLAVRRFVRDTLVRQGAVVATFGSGDEAYRAWQRRHFQVDLILTDIGLPGHLNGADLAEQIWRDRPDLPVIGMSARSELVEVFERAERRGAFLAKPFSPTALQATVARVMANDRDRKNR